MKKKLFVGLFFIFLSSCHLFKDAHNNEQKRQALIRKLRNNFFGEEIFELDTNKILEK